MLISSREKIKKKARRGGKRCGFKSRERIDEETMTMKP
jgi:hypothetical protein